MVLGSGEKKESDEEHGMAANFRVWKVVLLRQPWNPMFSLVRLLFGAGGCLSLILPSFFFFF